MAEFEGIDGCDELHSRINVITGSMFECLTIIASIDPDYFRREKAILADRFRFLYAGEGGPPSIAPAAIAPRPANSGPSDVQEALPAPAEPSPVPAAPKAPAIDPTKPMLVYLRGLKGPVPSIWPNGQMTREGKPVPYLQAYQLKEEDAQWRISELEKMYPFTATIKEAV
jgi:hypothetical protein